VRGPSAFRVLCWAGALAALTACGREADSDAEADRPSDDAVVQVEGTVVETARMAGVVLVEGEAGEVWSVSMVRRPPVRWAEGGAASPEDLLPGLPVAISGRRIGAELIRPDSVTLLAQPPVILAQPRARARLASPVVSVEGHSYRGRPARYRLLHGDEVLEEGTFRAEAFGARRYGGFSGTVSLAGHRISAPVVLEVWAEGSEGEPLRRALRFAPERILTLYYPARSPDAERRRCGTVHPVRERVPMATTPEEVVRRLADPPASGGLYAALGAYSGVRGVTLRGDSARVDLAGPASPPDPCDAEASEAQIQRTLSEAFGVRHVRVTVEGRSLRTEG
jgi:hypothetical protein